VGPQEKKPAGMAKTGYDVRGLDWPRRFRAGLCRRAISRPAGQALRHLETRLAPGDSRKRGGTRRRGPGPFFKTCGPGIPVRKGRVLQFLRGKKLHRRGAPKNTGDGRSTLSKKFSKAGILDFFRGAEWPAQKRTKGAWGTHPLTPPRGGASGVPGFFRQEKKKTRSWDWDQGGKQARIVTREPRGPGCCRWGGTQASGAGTGRHRFCVKGVFSEGGGGTGSDFFRQFPAGTGSFGGEAGRAIFSAAGSFWNNRTRASGAIVSGSNRPRFPLPGGTRGLDGEAAFAV